MAKLSQFQRRGCGEFTAKIPKVHRKPGGPGLGVRCGHSREDFGTRHAPLNLYRNPGLGCTTAVLKREAKQSLRMKQHPADVVDSAKRMLRLVEEKMEPAAFRAQRPELMALLIDQVYRNRAIHDRMV